MVFTNFFPFFPPPPPIYIYGVADLTYTLYRAPPELPFKTVNSSFTSKLPPGIGFEEDGRGKKVFFGGSREVERKGENGYLET
jgi:hypothetical protein